MSRCEWILPVLVAQKQNCNAVYTCFIWVVYTMFKPAGDGQANGQDDKFVGGDPPKSLAKSVGFQG